MSRQLTLDIPLSPAMGRADFMEAPCNADALHLILHPDDWPGGKLALIGPEGAGKSHLVQIWKQANAAEVVQARALTLKNIGQLGPKVAVEDADQILGHAEAQEALFHLHNALHNKRGVLLVTGRTPPARWAFALADLQSRLAALTVAELGPPDDSVLSALLGKLFSDRQLAPPPTLIPYLSVRMPRSFAAARAIVAELDHRALSEGRPLGRTLAAEVMAGLPQTAE